MEKECKPYYQNELSIYEKETLRKIEEFRKAKSNWGTFDTNTNQAIYTKVKEGLDESNIYQGRCLCLRRLRLKTTFLINHFKTLKPLRYYTLKKKIPEYKKFDSEYEREIERKLLPRSVEETCSSRKLWTREALEECFRGAYKVKDRRTRIMKKKECKQKRPGGPCKKVIRKLKASKFSGGIVESCRCEDGREVTVVIKGICLCDKGSLNNFNLNKVCDEYSKMTNRATGGPVPPAQAKLNQNIPENNAQVNKGVEPEERSELKTEEGSVGTEKEIKSVVETEPENKTQPESVAETKPEEKTKPESVAETEPEEKTKPESEVENKDENLAGQEKKSSFGVDSLIIYKKRRAADTTHGEQRTGDDIDENQAELPQGTRKISFKTEDLKSEKKEKSKINGGSEVTLYPKETVSQFSKSSNEELQNKFVPSDSLRNLLRNSESKVKVANREKGVISKSDDTESKDQSKEKSKFMGPDESSRVGAVEIDKKVTKNSNLKASKNSNTELAHRSVSNRMGSFNRAKNSLEFPKKINQNDSGKTNDQKKENLNMPDSKSKINVVSEPEKETSLPNISGRGNNGSMISLYRNKPQEKSYMSLTKEELEKLKRNTKLSDGKNLLYSHGKKISQ